MASRAPAPGVGGEGGEARAMVLALARAGCSRSLVAAADDAMKRRGTEPALLFWRAYGAAREGNVVAALRDCDALRSRREAEYAALLAAAHYHAHAKLVDRDALAAVDAALPGA
jgi:hypothetical protein